MKPLRDLIGLLFPRYCAGCFDALQYHERTICTSCKMTLPYTDYKPQSSNPIEKHFWGKVEVESAVALIQFHKGTAIMNLLHELKYRNNEHVGEILGKLFYNYYEPTDFFTDVDYIIPVPLHEKKLSIRGYNQCSSICRGLNELSGIEVLEDGLKRNRANQTQTKKGRFERFENTQSLFSVLNEKVVGKNVLLIDDVITTGSTLEACVKPLVESNCKVRIGTLAAPVD